MLKYKPQTKFSIATFVIIILALTLCLSSLAKTEVYFSLYDDPETVIIENINKAEVFIDIAMYTFTDKEISQAVIEAKERGVKVRIYLDRSQVEAKYSSSRLFVEKDIEVRISSNNYIMHNKFAVIDSKIVITGSYNWTASASIRNDENLLVIDDEEVIQRYQRQFENLWENKYSYKRTKELYNKAGQKLLYFFTTTMEGEPEKKIININNAFLEDFIQVLGVSEHTAKRIIELRYELEGFKDPKDITKLIEIGTIEWEEWIEEGIIIIID
jgi:DNA uptake protein ComE-like DNA-binding protein